MEKVNFMSKEQRQDDCTRIYEKWHEYARSGNVEAILTLYASDAIFESPLVPAILDIENGTLQGHQAIRQFLEEGTRRRPNELVRWYRTGTYFCNGQTLIWEYPRETPNGEQVDILEVMDIEDGKICHHRIYWGWFGFSLLQKSAAAKANR